MKRALALLLTAGSLALPAAAAGHVKVSTSSPAAGSKVSRSLGSVTVKFTGALRSGKLKVFKVRGGKASRGKGSRDPRDITRLRTEMKNGLGRGKYRAKWKIVAADGHEQKGSFTFKLK